MQNKKIIIIGSGIAGMSAGCYGQMNGYDTEIYEMHDKHGGLCTAWKRKDYIIDGCYEWMIGINPDSIFNKFWMEVGALQNKEIKVHQEFCRCEFGSDNTVIFYADADQLRSHLIKVSPEDAGEINEITTAIKKLSGFFGYVMSKNAPRGLAGKIMISFKSLPVLKTAEKRFPSIRGKIEVVDVATPLTYVRYTNVWRGAYMTWITTPNSEILTKISNKLPGLENFYMAGQWVSSPGTPGALRTGRKVIQDICKKEGKIFQTSEQ